MPKSRNIVVIVPDPVLCHSLAFALEADDYHVCSFSSWSAASDSLPDALCILADEKAFSGSGWESPDWTTYFGRLILLTEVDNIDTATAKQVLTKPLTGADVLSAVDKFAAAQVHYV